MKEIGVLCFLWSNPTFRSQYTVKNVQVLHSMLKRNLKMPFTLYCATNEPRKIRDALKGEIRIIPISDSPAFQMDVVGTWPAIESFNPEVQAQIKESTILKLDLDSVIVSRLDSFLESIPIDADKMAGWLDWTHKILNPSFNLMQKGFGKFIYDAFLHDKKTIKTLIEKGLADKFGWDQSFIAQVCPEKHKIYLSKEDGILHRREIEPQGKLPNNAKIVYFNSTWKPWHDKMKLYHPWIKNHYL